ncbi:MAG: DNA alkylation repair protein [Candidatus Delongbacteria bacterium]|nr:DNA alkylation repair protein [Candidatus Delongbacteria bacterium]
MNPIVDQVRLRLNESADPAVRESGQRFFKEEVRLYGVQSAVVGRIARECFKLIRDLPKSEILICCDRLWQSGMMEETFVACDWSYQLRTQYQPSDFSVFERWVHQNVSNWASCDTLCNHTIGSFIDRYPAYLDNLKSWTPSSNRWDRRAAAVSLIIPAREGRYLEDIFRIADQLLMDSDDLVRKGYGWMLKAASQAHPEAVFDYVMSNKARMPRTALRYAIEKMPADWKRQAMAK